MSENVFNNAVKYQNIYLVGLWFLGYQEYNLFAAYIYASWEVT